MPTVSVYYFRKYDITSDEIVQSPRPATRDAIAKAQGQPIEQSVREIDASKLDAEGFLAAERNK